MDSSRSVEGIIVPAGLMWCGCQRNQTEGVRHGCYDRRRRFGKERLGARGGRRALADHPTTPPQPRPVRALVRQPHPSRERGSATSSNVRPLRCPSEPVLPTAACPGDRSPIMANRDHPTSRDADNNSGGARSVACSDWRHDDADSISARDTTFPPQMPDIRLQVLPQQPSNPIRSPTCGRSPYTNC